MFRNPLDTQNALGPLKKDVELSDEMSSYWISFVHSGDPNKARDEGKLGDEGVYWPKYKEGERGSVAWVRDGLGRKSKVIKDDYRKVGMELLMDVRSGRYDHGKYKNLGQREKDEL